MPKLPGRSFQIPKLLATPSGCIHHKAVESLHTRNNMSWIRRKLSKVTNSSQNTAAPPPAKSQNPSTVRYEVFKSHWLQVSEVICSSAPENGFVSTKETALKLPPIVTQDDVDATRNLFEQMIYLLVEEQTDLQLGPILEYVITEGIFDKLYQWSERCGELKEQVFINQIKIYEVMISQAQPSLLHHKQIVNPMLKLLLSCSDLKCDEVDSHVILLLNLLCVWINRDPTLLDIFFRLSDDQGPANFLIFSLLIEFVHKEGSIGQQARDALLLCMTLSSENEHVSEYIISTNFCPVLATGLSGLYSSLPRQMDVRAEEWHFLRKEDWSNVPSLVNFMNSLEFCNSVVQAASSVVVTSLLNYIYNGFLVLVFGPALHKSSANEVIVTTAYLNLFLQSVTAPALLQCFLRFILCHSHDNSLIINTLIQRIGSSSRLALVSLSLFRTLLDLNCEDLMLHLVFRYLIPCNHILTSQRRSMRDTDMYSASALRFIALAPNCCSHLQENGRRSASVTERLIEDRSIVKPISQTNKSDSNVEDDGSKPSATSNSAPKEDGVAKSDGKNVVSTDFGLPAKQNETPESASTSDGMGGNAGDNPVVELSGAVSEYTVNEDLTVTINMHTGPADKPPAIITSPGTMAEFGPDLRSQVALHTSYMDYLEDARNMIDGCREACKDWSEPYDGDHPSSDSVLNKGTWDDKQDIHRSTPALNQVDEEFNVYKTYTYSDPCPVRNVQNESYLSSSALDALNATYKALDLTAQALTEKNEDEKMIDRTYPPNSAGPGNGVSEGDADSATENTDNAAQTQVNVSEAEDEESGSKKDALKLDLSKSKNIDIQQSSTLSTPVEEKSKTLSPIQSSSSSVDEFFRALMESVPKNARERAEKSLSTKTDLAIVNTDEESGIEVSSNGDDPLSFSPEFGVDKGTEEDVTANPTSEPSDDVAEFDDESSLNRSMDDEDWDDEDSTSVNSSSFYEPEADFTPTDCSLAPPTPLKMHSTPFTGPFLSTLFGKVDQMMSNSLYENLLLTGIISRLSCYPQPLLRSFLLNTHVVFHPAVRSLYQVLNSVRNRIDTFATGVTEFRILVRRAQKFLLNRGMDPQDVHHKRDLVQDIPMPVPQVKTKNTILGEVFLRRKRRKSRRNTLETLLEKHGNRKIAFSMGNSAQKSKRDRFVSNGYQSNKTAIDSSKTDDLRIKNAAYAAVVLHEFLKELAAISQEHAVASG